MYSSQRFIRREYLKYLAAATLGSSTAKSAFSQDKGFDNPTNVEPKPVAAVITNYKKRWHGDLIAGKIMEGWRQDGGSGPALRLASMYVDQLRPDDLAHQMSKRHNVPIFDSIEEAVTVGGKQVAVDGVISVGEHGHYPTNDKGQHLYPRRRFFEEITDTFVKYGRVVPVFSDKHLGPVWSDAKWMYDRACQLEIPFMAGSSLPISFRKPDISVPMGSEIEAAVGIGYSGLDIYGSHTLGCFQSLVERRRGSETGVKSVQCLQGEAMWEAVDGGVVPQDVLNAAIRVTPKQENKVIRSGNRSALFLIQYMDGLLGTVLMLPDYAAGISSAVKLKDQPDILATHFEERYADKLPHFAYLLKAVERMIHTGCPSYPVERTLLVSGVLDRVITSRFQGSEKLMTPELAIAYQAVDYPHAPRPDLDSAPVVPTTC